MTELPYKISTLIYFRNEKDELLLLKRNKAPNFGLWSPIGGKLEMASGESPFEAAKRETFEEVGLQLDDKDLHLFAMIAEKSYENRVHWLMFLFDCKRRLEKLPPPISEGEFAFHSKTSLDSLEIPESDKKVIWPIYFNHRNGFVSMRIDCSNPSDMNFVTEEFLPGSEII